QMIPFLLLILLIHGPALATAEDCKYAVQKAITNYSCHPKGHCKPIKINQGVIGCEDGFVPEETLSFETVFVWFQQPKPQCKKDKVYNDKGETVDLRCRKK
ncbi:hypothetical protein PENTCL1PPCAC_691, partial [Pristionchus entomophagus]